MARPTYPSDASDKILLRLPDGLRERVKMAADLNKRSMNSEIIATLDLAYPHIPTIAEMDKLLRHVLRDALLARDEDEYKRLYDTLNAVGSWLELKQRSAGDAAQSTFNDIFNATKPIDS